MATKSRGYKDISLDFVPNPVTGDLNVLKNERAITRSVKNLVQTGINERFYSTLGTDITDSLFGFVDVATGSVIARQIQDQLASWEPRIADVIVEAFPFPDRNAFEVIVSYEIVGQDYSTQSFSFLLEATR
jgi:hypothetical protein|tara:strand:- start:21 stop:413 length:393 start_codon:yes stop_codon:yes gene_type:complete